VFELVPFSKPTYWLNYTAVLATSMGASMGDVELAMRPYLKLVEERRDKFAEVARLAPLHFGADSSGTIDDAAAAFVFETTPVWTAGFSAAGEALAARADRFLSSGCRYSAAETYTRAAALVTIAEWSMHIGDEKRAAYDRARALTMTAIAANDVDVRTVRIPYGGVDLHGLYWPAPNVSGPQPLAICFNGLHSYMEWFWQNGLVRELNRRSIAVLTFDCPGSGHARFHQHLHLEPETEKYSRAALNWAARQSDIDMNRVAAVGCSFGGYRAVRAAAKDDRYRMCLAWGAFYEQPQAGQKRSGEAPSAPIQMSGLDLATMLWFNGVETIDEFVEHRARFTLHDVLAGLTCDLSIFHGESDMQVPLNHATRTYDGAVNARSRELVVVGREEGGEQHCHLDNLPTWLCAMTDRVALGLGGRLGL